MLACMFGSQECPNCCACKESVEHVLFECVSYDSHRLIFFNCLKMVLPLFAFEAFLHGRIFDKTAFCLIEKPRYINVALGTIE